MYCGISRAGGQVTRLLTTTRLLQAALRGTRGARSLAPAPALLHRLERRSLLQVRGAGGPEEASGFLQGLLTNDMRHLAEGASCLYAMLLNTKGRVLYDTLVHRTGADRFLLECDAAVVPALLKHLKVYRLRKKVDINDVSDNFSVYALQTESKPRCDILKEILINKDPRIHSLGFRIITPANLNLFELCSMIGENTTLAEPDDYKYLRYRLGVGEGADDLAPGACFPLEANCDYLHGVSFHKGCYIGQELTARVHHTGVVRKRFMPIKFTTAPTGPIEKDSVISSSSNPKANLGKFKGVISDYGLALLRTTEALRADCLLVGGAGVGEGERHTAAAVKPHWWPIEAPKEKINI